MTRARIRPSRLRPPDGFADACGITGDACVRLQEKRSTFLLGFGGEVCSRESSRNARKDSGRRLAPQSDGGEAGHLKARPQQCQRSQDVDGGKSLALKRGDPDRL